MYSYEALFSFMFLLMISSYFLTIEHNNQIDKTIDYYQAEDIARILELNYNNSTIKQLENLTDKCITINNKRCKGITLTRYINKNKINIIIGEFNGNN